MGLEVQTCPELDPEQDTHVPWLFSAPQQTSAGAQLKRILSNPWGSCSGCWWRHSEQQHLLLTARSSSSPSLQTQEVEKPFQTPAF